MTIANRTTHPELTDLQMHLVEHSFEWIAQDYSHFSEQFRKFLLRSHPEFVDMLEPISTTQFQLTAMISLTSFIHSLNYPEHMRVISQLLHDQEYPPDIQREMYDAFCDALMNVLSEIAEDAWSPALEGAWKTSIDLTKFQLFHGSLQRTTEAVIQESPFGVATRRVHSRALVVDDDKQVRHDLCTHLENLGYDCYEAENGAVALHFLEGILQIDVVVTDNDMPVLSGMQLLQSLASLPENQRPPCILSSSNLSRDVVDQALQLGAWSIIAKPYSYEDLHETMVQAMQTNSPRQTHRSRKEDQ